MQDVMRMLEITQRLLDLHAEIEIAMRRGQPARLQRAMETMQFYILLERGNALNTMEAFEAAQATYMPEPACASDETVPYDPDSPAERRAGAGLSRVAEHDVHPIERIAA